MHHKVDVTTLQPTCSQLHNYFHSRQFTITQITNHTVNLDPGSEVSNYHYHHRNLDLHNQSLLVKVQVSAHEQERENREATKHLYKSLNVECDSGQQFDIMLIRINAYYHQGVRESLDLRSKVSAQYKEHMHYSCWFPFYLQSTWKYIPYSMHTFVKRSCLHMHLLLTLFVSRRVLMMP